MSIDRFYYQWITEYGCWCVYDREYVTIEGDPIAIAQCPSKTWAVRLRDALLIWNEVPSHAQPRR